MDRIAVCGTVDLSPILSGSTKSVLEGWPSGSWRTPRKRVGESPQRFKSSTLRNLSLKLQNCMPNLVLL